MTDDDPQTGGDQPLSEDERTIERIEAQMLERHHESLAPVADFITDDEIERFVRSHEEKQNAEQARVPKGVSKQEFLEAVRAGIHDAMRETITGGTSTPGADFFGAIQAGVEVAMKAAAREREGTTGALRPDLGPGTHQEPQTNAPVAERGPKP